MGRHGNRRERCDGAYPHGAAAGKIRPAREYLRRDACLLSRCAWRGYIVQFTKGIRMTRPFISAALALTLIVPLSALAAEETYVIEPVHSQPIFELQHMGGFSTQRGSFGKVSGKVVLDRATHKGSADVTIDTSSIHTISEKLDTHVKGEDFFNVAKYPTMTFKSSNLTFDGDKLVAMDGELTMLGIAK